MLPSLAILIVTALYCAALGLVPGRADLARWVAVVGTGAALVVLVARETLGTAGVAVAWPGWLAWLGETIYREDALGAGLGAWCLMLGLLGLLKLGRGDSAPWQLANAVALLAVLFSLAHTDHLLAFAGQLFLLAALLLAGQTLHGSMIAEYSRSAVGLGLGALLLLGAALLLGRATGGAYSLAGMSLSALTVWPVLLLGGFVVLWLGMPPFTGWSARWSGDGASAVLAQSLGIGVPVVVMLLRLQGLVSSQAFAGSVPAAWAALMGVLAWFGAIGTLVAACGLLVWAGSARWTSMLTAYNLAMVVWALSLDNPAGRLAALVIMLSYGAARTALALTGDGASTWERLARAVGIASLACSPLTASFLGVWLLVSSLSVERYSSVALVLVGAGVVAAFGIVLHHVATDHPAPAAASPSLLSWLGPLAAITIMAGGTLPGLWLTYVSRVAEIGGGTPPVNLPWEGVGVGGNFVPVLMLGLGALLIAFIGWLVAAVSRSRTEAPGVLLPTGLDRVERAREAAPAGAVNSWEGAARLLIANPPPAVWWLSLAWLEGGVWGFGVLLGRLGTRFGGLLGRLEGRFYLPLTLILVLVALLLASR
ncbi:MAG: hypothetical protein QOH93_2433 [Chloroflexia bacterium]|jgi:hypothetical protein|nr:hypothetical protein [Chloroflexia bacterium]